jgi:hypothetical protein
MDNDPEIDISRSDVCRVSLFCEKGDSGDGSQVEFRKLKSPELIGETDSPFEC